MIGDTMSRRIDRWICAAFMFALCACSASSGAPPTPGKRAAAHFGAAQLDAVIAPDRCDVYRLEPYVGPPSDAPAELVAGNAVMGAKGSVPRAGWSEELARVLVRDASYEWDMAKGCEPMSGVLVRYARGAERVDVSFCFECEMLSIAPVGSDAWEDFDPVRRELVALVQEVFPGDAAIQALSR